MSGLDFEQDTKTVRISRKISMLALAALCAMPAVSLAQDTKSDAPAAPANAAQQFGPRAGKPADGNDGGGSAPKPEIVGTFGAWQVQCTNIPAQGDNPATKSCRMIQLGKTEKSEKLAISVAVNKVKQGDKSAVFMQILAPIGVYLPTGIPVEIDGAALPNRLPFTRCVPQFCEGLAEASPDSLAKFKKGSSAIFYIYDRPGNGFPMKISLDGFGAALADLDKR